MKRLIVMVCLLLMLSVSAYAEWELPVFDEAFSIRNGISFGMTKNEVASVEKANGNVSDANEATRIRFKNVSFLGKNVYVSHLFTKDDKLSSFAYSGMGSVYSTTSHTFADIFGVLAEKYGEPMLTTELSLYSTAIWAAKPFDRGEWSADTLSGGASPSSPDGSIWISNYAVWLVKYTDCAVVIELAEANKGKWLSLGYASISHEAMEAWVEYREKENQAIQNSYANDI